MVAATARPAEACSPPPDRGLDLWHGDDSITDVPTDGVLAFRVTAYGSVDDALALLTVDVVLGEESIAGTFSNIEISDGGEGLSDHIVVWRPDAGWTPDSSYAVTLSVRNPDDPEAPEPVDLFEATLTTSAEAAGALPVPTLDGALLVANQLPEGRRVCCEGEIGACFADCAAVDLVEHPNLSTSLSLGTDPMLGQSYVRLLAGAPDALEPYATLGLGNDLSGELQLAYDFAEVGDSYCLGVELVSLIDESVSEPVVVCSEHGDLVLGSSPNPALDLLVEECAAPYWEDDGSPYEPDGGTEGGDESGDESGGGSSEGGDATAGEAGEDSGDDDAGLGDDVETDGCACGVDGTGNGWASLGMLVAFGWARRRRPST